MRRLAAFGAVLGLTLCWQAMATDPATLAPSTVDVPAPDRYLGAYKPLVVVAGESQKTAGS